jgi:uncharacterized paraquat-inducible protein A
MVDTLDANLPLTLGQRFFIAQEAKYQATFSGRAWAVTSALVVLVLLLIGGVVLSAILGMTILAFALFIASMTIIITVAIMASRSLYAPFARREARRRGFDVCMSCGYWLHGLGADQGRCPECGATREPMINRVEQ